MLETIGAYDAKTKLPEILRRVAAGSHSPSQTEANLWPISYRMVRSDIYAHRQP